MHDPIGDILRSAKWLPAEPSGEVSASGNLLAMVAVSWRRAAGLTPSNDDRVRRASRWTEWIEQQLAAGAQLTVDCPPRVKDPPRARADSRLTGRLCWWPRGIPEGQWVAIISSRLGKCLDLRPEWFDVFRSACARIDVHQSVLLAGTRTTTARFAERAAELFNLPTLMVHEPRSGDSVSSWLRKCRRRQASRTAANLYEVFLSPPLVSPDRTELARPDFAAVLSPSGRGKGEDPPLGDRVVVDWADQVFVAHLRPGGNLEPLIRARLMASQPDAPDVFVALGPRLVPRQLADELLGLGAVGWLLLPESDRDESADSLDEEHSMAPQASELCRSNRGHPVAAQATKLQCRGERIVSLDALLLDRVHCDWDFLTHCTRRPAGPWPEQSNQEFLDELLSQRRSAVRSPLVALTRIVTQQRIAASVATLRGGTPAVCFTAVPLADLHRLRTFQPHRHRWDFEPYGICVQQDWLIGRGARAVLYGDEEDWQTLSAVDRPFFQRRETRHSGRHHDWTHEREWRHLGDVDLSLVSPDAALVFVPTVDEAEQLAPVSHWPIVICR